MFMSNQQNEIIEEAKKEFLDEQLLQLPATISKITTMANRALRIVFDSQEELNDEQRSKLIACDDRLGWLCFLPGESMIGVNEVADLPELKDESEQKTPSQRLRGVIFLNWEQQTGEYKSKYPFEIYYRGQMEKIIEAYKQKLN
jgi:hypothetical protein